MQEEEVSRHTNDALDPFLPGQKVLLKPLDSGCEVSFTVCKLSMPVTKSVVVLAKPDAGNSEEVVIKIFDPRYLDERRSSHPWNLSNEQAAEAARFQDLKLTDEELEERLYSDESSDLSGGALQTHYLLWEERFYRLMVGSYDSEYKAYERLKDLQGSTIPRLLMAGQFLPPDERAIRPPALVLQYIPSINLHDAPSAAITPAIRAQLLSAIESFPSHGVIHNDITMTNIHFTPPGQPVRGFVIDFGCAMIREEDDEDEDWKAHGESDLKWARRLLEDEELRKSFADRPKTEFT